MAGGHWHALKTDPKIEQWAHMREHVYQHFKFTPKATRVVVTLGLVVPASIFYLNRHYAGKFDLTGKLRGESLYANPPAAVQEEAAA